MYVCYPPVCKRTLNVVARLNMEEALEAILKINQSINESKRIYIAPYVASESEAHVGLD